MKPSIDMSGQRFGKWLVLDLCGQDKAGNSVWHCRCDCGTERNVLGPSLRRGRSTSCGCSRHHDAVGERYGRLVVKDMYKTQKASEKWICVCKCDCGAVVDVELGNLIHGMTSSCGCYRKELGFQQLYKHGLSDTRLYRLFYGMHARCEDERSPSYANYGGRGIVVCEEWKEFKAFYDWAMSHGYTDFLTIERSDVNGPYSPQNCKWATPYEQGQNRRNTIFIEFDGEIHSISDWALITGVKRSTIYDRYKKGWPASRILNTGGDMSAR